VGSSHPLQLTHVNTSDGDHEVLYHNSTTKVRFKTGAQMAISESLKPSLSAQTLYYVNITCLCLQGQPHHFQLLGFVRTGGCSHSPIIWS